MARTVTRWPCAGGAHFGQALADVGQERRTVHHAGGPDKGFPDTWELGTIR
jgi:hypothetical protein